MNGKITMSRRGRTGRTSGTLGVSSLPVGAAPATVGSSLMGVLAALRKTPPCVLAVAVPDSSFLALPLDDDHGGPPPPVFQPRHADGEEAAGQPGLRAAHVHGHVERHQARE